MLSETSPINSPDVYLLIYFVMLWCALTLNMFTFHPINDQIDSRTNKTSWWHLWWLEIKMPHYCQFNWVSSLSARCSVRPLLATVFMSCLTLVNIFQVEKFNRMLQNFPPKFIKRTLGQSCNFHRKLQQIIFHNVFHLHQCEALKSPKWRVNPPLFQFRDWIACCRRPSQLCSTYLIFIMFANLQILHSYDDTVDYIITNRASGCYAGYHWRFWGRNICQLWMRGSPIPYPIVWRSLSSPELKVKTFS